jgi:acyl carrier protein
MTEQENKIRDLLERESGVDREKIVVAASLQHDLNCDSLDLVEIAMEIEKEFDVYLPDDEQTKWKTVGDVYATVARVTAI